MALELITKKVLNLSEVPSEVLVDHWILEEEKGILVEVHVEDGPDTKPLEEWITTNYPELKDEDSFYIKIDINE